MDNEKYRVVVCRSFPNGEPLIASAYSLEDARKVLKRLTKENFQSSQDPASLKPGCREIAMIERWNEADQDWEFVDDGEV